MRIGNWAARALAVVAVVMPAVAGAQQRAPYGPAITLEQARVVLAAAQAEAQRNNWSVAIAIVDSGCNLVALHRMDNTNLGGVGASQDKARSSCLFRNPTRGVQEAIARGGMTTGLLQLRGIIGLEGGLPLVANGATVGAIGISGVQPDQDGQIARAGAEALR